jgi:hypothetical protein
MANGLVRNEHDYDEDKDQLEVQTGEINNITITTNEVF